MGTVNISPAIAIHLGLTRRITHLEAVLADMDAIDSQWLGWLEQTRYLLHSIRDRSDCVDKFDAFSTALRLVALVQTSSASVERLFSVLKLVVDAIGKSMLEETLETRLFVQYNMVRHGTYQSPAT
jgi:hypothetical protein